MFEVYRATPKPWVAGSNPPAPAKIIRTHSDECVLQSVEKRPSRESDGGRFGVFEAKND